MESILNGTWGGGASPPQWNDFILMKRMRWSWTEFQETPLYVRGFCLDFLGLIAEAEEAERKKSERKAARDARKRG